MRRDCLWAALRRCSGGAPSCVQSSHLEHRVPRLLILVCHILDCSFHRGARPSRERTLQPLHLRKHAWCQPHSSVAASLSTANAAARPNLQQSEDRLCIVENGSLTCSS